MIHKEFEEIKASCKAKMEVNANIFEHLSIMSSLHQHDELPIKPENNSREHDHAMAMGVEIVHEGQSWQVEQIEKESPEKEGESQKGQESEESQKKEGKSLTKEVSPYDKIIGHLQP